MDQKDAKHRESWTCRDPRALIGWGNPKVTGILPVALNKATKAIRALIHAGKEYICVMRLHGEVDEEKIRKVCEEFVGPIYQRPPLKSSVKRVVRIRTIYYIDVLEVSGKDVLMRIGCQAGTYIRKLCHDIGLVLGVGAHMQELRRTRSGPLKEDETLVTLYDLQDVYETWIEERDETPLRKAILPVERAVEHLPKIIIRDSAVDAICHGADLAAPGVLRLETGIKRGSLIAIMTQKGELVALAKAEMTSNEILEADKGIVAKTERVIMDRGTYPKTWRNK